jgi:hypothetical protein
MSFPFRSACHIFCSGVFAVTVAGLVQADSAVAQVQSSAQPSIDRGANGQSAVTHAAPVAFPLSFVPNQGQDPADVRFTTSGAAYTLQLRERSAVLQLGPALSAQNPAIELELLNSNPSAEISGASPLPGVTNYVPKSDPQSWNLNVPRFSRVEYNQVYPGTGLAFYAHQDSLEYDFRLQPGASTSNLRLAIRGAEAARVDGEGNLVLTSAGREIRFLKPVAYQIGANAAHEIVPARYTLARPARNRPPAKPRGCSRSMSPHTTPPANWWSTPFSATAPFCPSPTATSAR